MSTPCGNRKGGRTRVGDTPDNVDVSYVTGVTAPDEILNCGECECDTTSADNEQSARVARDDSVTNTTYIQLSPSPEHVQLGAHIP